MIEFLVNQITAVVSAVGYFGVFILMALESTVFPIPSEGVMPFAGFLVASGTFSFWGAWIASTLGCLAGSLTSYFLGYYGGVRFVRKFGRYFLLDEEHLIKSERWFDKKGSITIFLGRFVPGIRHVISIPAGVGKMNVFSFSFFTLLGAGIWNFVLIYLGYLLEKNWKLVYNYSRYIDLAVIFLVFCAVVYYVSYLVSHYRKSKRYVPR